MKYFLFQLSYNKSINFIDGNEEENREHRNIEGNIEEFQKLTG